MPTFLWLATALKFTLSFNSIQRRQYKPLSRISTQFNLFHSLCHFLFLCLLPFSRSSLPSFLSSHCSLSVSFATLFTSFSLLKSIDWSHLWIRFISALFGIFGLCADIFFRLGWILFLIHQNMSQLKIKRKMKTRKLNIMKENRDGSKIDQMYEADDKATKLETQAERKK